MQVVHARATFVTPDAVDESLTTMVARSVLEAALHGEGSAELWFDLADEGGEEVGRVSVDLSSSDIEELLGISPEDEIALSLDGHAIESLFSDADVEAHGLKGAIAIAVTSAAILAPAGHAAVPQSVDTAATAQRAQVAATAQVSTQVSAAATTQASSIASKAQVSLQNKPQVSKVAKVSGLKLKLLRSGFVQ